ncbi:MAG TPA: cytochrome c [Rubrivivax sp.]|nr:cytochrome c [Rubrivivax sp.]
MNTRTDTRHRFHPWGAAGILAIAAALSLAACGGGGIASVDTTASAATAAASGETKAIEASRPSAAAAVAQPANTEGRLLASNCFQCHGTLGTGGFDNIRGSEASEVLEYLTNTANRDIMAAHAQGYTRAQLQSIIAYLQQK